ncbi:hypothetical protein BGI03_08145 [Snodgrassella alvi]|uniref:hypothetical protein n=1 Tax=Snodgrassella alvi TaxID=1196083 RepID=UPI0009FE81C9|nr:hypothetical protein [Snodgrassella alvi]ORF06486.1 hypothetical protein BGH98_05895 [Snodgrassella alvi]ORF12452.1 hypothetical protein BGI01_06870 [Snodgrassella alvi]ORF17174.1 hypothetical protein BGI03_08145 [Snodgrassella alvi]ORF18437.1 hypothetical protein BGI04_08190 [Snodgrassella alvi]PXY98379.1 hypothetical protein DKK71_02240 [Snodgrassella alvi]
MLKNFVIWLMMLFCLSACQSLPVIDSLPVLKQTLTLQVTDKDGSNSLLLIEPLSEQQWRFVQVDGLGAPISRQILQQGKWHNDGFLPPNPKARQLFTAVYAYLGHQYHWSVPAELNDVRVSSGTDGMVAEIEWHKQHWKIREVTDE